MTLLFLLHDGILTEQKAQQYRPSIDELLLICVCRALGSKLPALLEFTFEIHPSVAWRPAEATRE